MNIKRDHWMLLAVIVILGGLVRFVDLENRPAGLFRDEAEKGYNAWALARTGGMIDIPPPAPGEPSMRWRRLPFAANIFGNRTSAIYHYASVPFMLGREMPTIAATRRAGALAGTLTVFFLGLLLMRASGPWPGIAAAAWLAVCPWHLVFSRWALEGIFVPFLMVLTLLGLYGVELRQKWGWPLAGGALGWMFYAYSGAQPLVLAWGFILIIIYRREIFHRASLRSPGLWIGLFLFLIPVLPTLMIRLQPGGSERLGRVAIWSDSDVSMLQVPIIFLKNYWAHLNPIFLFFSGDQQPRHAIPGMGQMTVLDLILLPVGMIYSFRKKLPLRGALLAAFLCGPIPAALTNEGIPHGLRAIGMLVPAVAWSGLGIAHIADEIYVKLASTSNRRRALTWTAILIVSVFTLGAYSVVRYWKIYSEKVEVQVAFQNGQREAWETIAAQRQPEQRVFLNGYLPFTIYYQLFYTHPNARSIGPDGPDPEFFVYYDPEQTSEPRVRAALRPGDWLLLPVLNAEQFDPFGPIGVSFKNQWLAGEPWVIAEQKVE